MIYDVTVIPNSKHARVVPIHERALKVYITQPPVDGKANNAVIKALKAYFRVSQSRIAIIHGHRSRNKRIEITMV